MTAEIPSNEVQLRIGTPQWFRREATIYEQLARGATDSRMIRAFRIASTKALMDARLVDLEIGAYGEGGFEGHLNDDPFAIFDGWLQSAGPETPE